MPYATDPEIIGPSTPAAGTSLLKNVFDISGRRVRAIASGSFAADEHRLTWDGRDDAGLLMSPGVHWVRVATPLARLDRKVVWVR